MVLLQELLGLACPSPILLPCTPPKDPLEATRHSKGSFRGPPTTMVLAQPLIKGHTGGLPLALALGHRPTEPWGPQLCLLIAGLRFKCAAAVRVYKLSQICSVLVVKLFAICTDLFHMCAPLWGCPAHPSCTPMVLLWLSVLLFEAGCAMCSMSDLCQCCLHLITLERIALCN